MNRRQVLIAVSVIALVASLVAYARSARLDGEPGLSGDTVPASYVAPRSMIDLYFAQSGCAGIPVVLSLDIALSDPPIAYFGPDRRVYVPGERSTTTIVRSTLRGVGCLDLADPLEIEAFQVAMVPLSGQIEQTPR